MSPSADDTQSSGLMYWLLIMSVAAGAALRFAWLTHQSFWYDEAVSAELAVRSFADIAAGRTMDLELGNPPFYLLVLHGWSLLCGSSDGALRAASGLFSLLSLPLVYALGRTLTDRATAAIATVLCALAPVQIYFAQEARGYTLVSFLCLASFAALLQAVHSPRRRSPWWVVYLGAIFLAVYTHYFAAFVAVAQALWILATFRHDPRRLIPFIVAAAGAAALFAIVWGPMLIEQLREPGNLGRSMDSWLLHVLSTPLTFGVGTTLVWKDLFSGPRVVAGVAAAAALVGLTAMGAWRLRHERSSLGLLVAWFTLPVALPALISAIVIPTFSFRYGLLAAPAYYLLIASGLSALSVRWRGALASVLVVAAATAHATYFTGPVKTDWREAVRWTRQQWRPGDLLVFDPDTGESPFSRYAPADLPRVRLTQCPETVDAHFCGTTEAGQVVRAVATPVDQAPRLVAVFSDEEGRYRDRLENGWTQVDRFTTPGIEILVFERR